MEIIQTNTINVEAVKSELLRQKTSRVRFKWPVSQKQAEDILLAAYMAEVEYRHIKFENDDKTRNNIAKVAAYLVNPIKFGLMLCGTCGNGKTTLMRAIQSGTTYLSNNGAFNIKKLEKVKTMSGEFVDRENVYENKIYIELVHAKEIIAKCRDYNDMESLKKKPYLGIDDLGVEPKEVLDYGNVCNPVLELLEYRYNEQLPTFVTTNLPPKGNKEKGIKGLDDHYGLRLADRFNEMMYKIVFNDGSYRK